MLLSCLGPAACVFTAWVSTGLPVGSGHSLRAARWQVFFISFLSSLRAHRWRAAIAHDRDILCWLTWQAIFYFSLDTVRGSSVCPQCRRPGFDPWVRKILWRRKWQPTPVFLPGESHGWRSLVGYSPRGREESDTTERLHFHFHSWGNWGSYIYIKIFAQRNTANKYAELSFKSRKCPLENYLPYILCSKQAGNLAG